MWAPPYLFSSTNLRPREQKAAARCGRLHTSSPLQVSGRCGGAGQLRTQCFSISLERAASGCGDLYNSWSANLRACVRRALPLRFVADNLYFAAVFVLLLAGGWGCPEARERPSGTRIYPTNRSNRGRISSQKPRAAPLPLRVQRGARMGCLVLGWWS